METANPINEKKNRVCVVPVCDGERFDLVHKFPNDKQRALEWLNILKIPKLSMYTIDQIRKRFFICSRHFKPSDYKNVESRGLNKTAYPSINLKTLDNLKVPDLNLKSKSRGNCLQTETEHATIKPNSINKDTFDEAIYEPSHYNMYPNENYNNEKTSLLLNTKLLNQTEASNKRKITSLNEIKKRKKHTNSIDCDSDLIVYKIDKDHIDDECSEKNLINSDFIVLRDDEDKILSDSAVINEIENIDKDSTREIETFPLLEENVVLPIELETDTSFSDNTIVINHPLHSEPLEYLSFWLRDHCRCEICYSAETFQRKFNLLDIPLDIKPKYCNVEDNNLIIEWSDGHKSNYDIDFLNKMKYEIYTEKLLNDQSTVLWDKNSIVESNYARVNLNDYLCNDDVAKNVVGSLIKYGVAFIEKVPANIQSTEIAIKRLFPIQKTLFGEMFTLTDHKTHSDSAYSKEFLPAHTDNTYFNDACGLQVLHCIHHSGTGGESLLLDGFKALSDLNTKHPNTFERLTKTNVPAEYIEEQCHHLFYGPLIKQDPISGNLEQIRFNLYDRAPLNSIPQDKVMEFYNDFRLLANEIQTSNNEWWFKLSPGTVMIFNNWRILHGRAQYTGKRTLVGSYVSRTDFMSTARSMGVIS